MPGFTIPGQFTLNVGRNTDGDGLVVSQPGSDDVDITVNSTNKPAIIRFVAQEGLYFDRACFSLEPTPPDGDFVISVLENGRVLQVIDNDTDPVTTTYKYTICAWVLPSPSVQLCYDPQIYNQAT